MTSDMLSDSAYRTDAEGRRLAMAVEGLQFQLAIAEELGQDASTLNCIQEEINTAQLAFEQYQAQVALTAPQAVCAVKPSSWRTNLLRFFSPWLWFKDETFTKPEAVKLQRPMPAHMTAGKRRMSTQ